MIDSAETFFGRGIQFMAACDMLESHYVRERCGPLAFPIVTMSAFTTEAYLKSLLILEGNAPPWTHNLRKLFDRLSSASQVAISDCWEKRVLPTVPQAGPPQYVPPKSLLEALDQSAMAFVEWRYINKGFGMWTLGDGYVDVARRIFDLKPDWRTNPPDAIGDFHAAG